MDITSITTFGTLKKAGFAHKTIKQEIRANLLEKIQNHQPLFSNMLGYDHTVLPQMERALLAGHSINLLGLRGQGKTRMARQIINLLDEYVPLVAGSELNDDPFSPVSKYAKDLLTEKGDETPIEWLHRNQRYVEKLATPDVTVADLIGDVDPIKAANLNLPYSDERVIHYGLVPRANRCVFVFNELPDLQPRIQVALFNILQEGDVQVRGFTLRLPLSIQFVFTANPEDYTNRGAIITPLKDRIQSQILTHYPSSAHISKQITLQEANLTPQQKETVHVNDLLVYLIEEIAIQARKSEYVDAKSGVSARLTISAYENLVATAEHRALKTGATQTNARLADLEGVLPAIIGKIELVYEGEQEGALNVAYRLIADATRAMAKLHFNGIDQSKTKPESPLYEVISWFNQDNEIELPHVTTDTAYQNILESVPGLEKAVLALKPTLDQNLKHIYMEFLLHALAAYSKIGRQQLLTGFHFKDLMGSLLKFE